MATVTAGQSGSGNAHMQCRITYTAGSGSITITKLEGCRTDGYDVVSTNGAAASNYVIITIAGAQTSKDHRSPIKFGKNNGWTEFWSGSSSKSGMSGNQTVQITFSNTQTTNIENSKFVATIDAGSAKDPAPYNVSINPIANGRTAINLQRAWERATYCQYNINNWGWLAEGGTYSNGVKCNGNDVTGLTANTSYSCQVRFGNGNSDLTYSNTASCTTSGNAPTINSVTPAPARTSCSLANNSVSYDTNASYKSVSVKYGTTTSYGSTVSSTSITGLSPNTKYYYSMTITDNFSRTSAAKTGNFTTTCNKPSSLSISSTGKTYNSISVKVGATGDTNAPITNYTLYYKTSSASTYSNVSLGTATTKTISGLTDNTTYNLYFTATNAGGTTTSSTINVTTVQGRAVVVSVNGGSFTRRRIYISENGGAFKLISKPGLHVYINGTKKL